MSSIRDSLVGAIKGISRASEFSVAIRGQLAACPAEIQSRLEEIAKLKNCKTMHAELKALLDSFDFGKLENSQVQEVQEKALSQEAFVPTPAIPQFNKPEMSETEARPELKYILLKLKDRIAGHVSQTKDYAKRPCHYNDKKKHILIIWTVPNPTGGMLRLNEIRFLCILDLDVNHDLKDLMPEDEVRIVRANIIDTCGKRHFILGKTTSGDGFHIYANCDRKWIEFAKSKGSSKDVCRITGIRIRQGLTLDIFTSMKVYETEEDKANGNVKVNNVMMIGSFVKYANSDTPKHSEFIVGDYNEVVNYNVEDVLNEFGWMENVQNHNPQANGGEVKPKVEMKPVEAEVEKPEYPPMKLSHEVQIALIEGIDGSFPIYTVTDTGDSFKNHVSTLSLFPGLNALDEDLIEMAYDRVWPIYRDSYPETHTMKSFMGQRKAHSKKEKPDLKNLFFVIKEHNPKYFEEKIQPLIAPKFELKNIDFRDEFTITDFCEKAKAQEYKNLDEAAIDLSRVMRYCAQGIEYYLEKTLHTLSNTMQFTAVFPEREEKKLKKIELFTVNINGKDKVFTAYDAFREHYSEFLINGTTFNTDLKKCVKVWNSWKYKPAEIFNPDDPLTKNYFEFVKEGLCGYSPDGTDTFVHKCIAKILQKPGYKLRITFILQGIHRAGKGTFTDILCELTAGFSQPNINNIADIVGDFNKMVENKVVVVLNEQQDKNGKPTKIIGALKSKSTDATMAVGEKQEPKRIVENVMNIFICMNAARGIGIEASDPRYLVLDVCGKYRQSDLLRKLHNPPKEFYENLMAYYMNLDVSNFEPEDEKPNTAAEADLKFASISYAEEFIRDNYHNFSNKEYAYTESDLISVFNESKFKDRISLNTFLVDVRNKCQRENSGGLKKIMRNGSRTRVYLLKDEYLETYKTEIDDEDEKE